MKGAFVKINSKLKKPLHWLWMKISREKRKALKPVIKQLVSIVCTFSDKMTFLLSPRRVAFSLMHPYHTARSVYHRSLVFFSIEKRKKAKADIELLSSSGFFDEDFYLSMYPDVARYSGGAVKHYYYHGWRERRHPHANFNDAFFLFLK